MQFDYHVHSNYSDGTTLPYMIRAAEEAGLDVVGFSDHCTVSEKQFLIDKRLRYGMNMDITFKRRRQAIDKLQEHSSVTILNAAEMDYEPGEEAKIRGFLDRANFDYTLGSIHFIRGNEVHNEHAIQGLSEEERADLVERYFDKLISLIESELFDIAAHIDVIERNRHLRGIATEQQYRNVASAFKKSRTIPEINAGRALRDMRSVHPVKEFFNILQDENISFTVGTDSHAPKELVKRNSYMDSFLKENSIAPVQLDLERR